MSLFVPGAQQSAIIPRLSYHLLPAGIKCRRFYSQVNATTISETKGPFRTASLKGTNHKRGHIQQGNMFHRVPTGSLLRSLVVSSVAFVPQPILAALIGFAKRRSSWIEAIPPLRLAIRRTFYDTFCIGATKEEIGRNVEELRSLGIRGVILAFGREAKGVPEAHNAEAALASDDPGLRAFVQFNLETIDKLSPGDYLAVRCTGAGKSTLRVMDDFAAVTTMGASNEVINRISAELEVFQDALQTICSASQARGIKVLIDAEDTARQLAIDTVTLRLMPMFNRDKHAVILNTYQMYLKSGITKLRAHLQHSAQNNYILGVKMVRGAFLSTEPQRNFIHDTKEDTDRAYDEAVRLLVQSHGTSSIDKEETSSKPPEKRWAVDVLLATHNTQSVREAMRLYRELIKDGGNKWAPGTGLQSLAFAQLKGMADELTFELTSEIKKLPAEVDQTEQDSQPEEAGRYPSIGVYKYSVWGTSQECLLYMLRRAEENKGALARSKTTAMVMAKELLGRMFSLRRYEM